MRPISDPIDRSMNSSEPQGRADLWDRSAEEAALSVDPISLEVMRNALQSATEEMSAALVRTAYSTNIKDRRDCSCAMYASSGEVVAQSEIGTPLHLGVMPAAVDTVLRRFGLADLDPGDQIILNQPFPGGPGHLNDVTLVAPVHHAGEVVALVANLAHHVDVGGFAPGSIASGLTEIFQEGVQIPPVKLVKQGKLVSDIASFFLANVRMPTESRGDLLAQIAANNVGVRRVEEIAARVGALQLSRFASAILDYAERRARAGISLLPEGTYEFEDYLEGAGPENDASLTLRATVTIKAGEVLVDFAGTSDQVRGPINCPLATTKACVYYVIKSLVDPDLPANSGAYRVVEVKAPPGSLVNASHPNAVGQANTVTSQRLVDVLLGALMPAAPQRIGGASSGSPNLMIIGGTHTETGRPFGYMETYGGGEGALPTRDGMAGVQTHTTNTRNAPIEAIEQAYPLRVECYGLVPDSEGAGVWRGGFGIMRRIVTLEDATLTLCSDRVRIRPWGAAGGEAAAGAETLLREPTGEVRVLPAKITLSLAKGSELTTKTPGGGGWGDPRSRDRARVAQDVQEGLVSAQRAAEVYGGC